MSSYDVIVVGAGIGGLSCAAFLAKAGLNVLIIEALDRIGGVCHTTKVDGFSFEDGALWLSMDYLCHETFACLGVDFDTLVPTTKNNPTTRCILPDGETFLFSPDREAVEAEVARLSPVDVPNFHQFLDEMRYRSAFISSDLFSSPITWRTFLSPKLWWHAPFLLESYANVIRRSFRDERLRLTFSRPTLFLGLPPSRCPAAFALSPYGEIEAGSSYPRGGMGRIPAALGDVAIGFGATILKGTSVDRFMVSDHRVTGVGLQNGEVLEAKAVVSNIHVQPTYLHLIGRDHLDRRIVRRMESLELGTPNIAVQLGLDFVVNSAANSPQLPPLNEMEGFWETIENRLPEKLYPNAAIPSPEAGVAPPGCSVVNITHDVPLDPGPCSWEEIKEEFADRLITKVENVVGLPLRGHILCQRIRTPADLVRKSNLHKGAKYGLSPTLRQYGPFRPSNRSPWIKRLYLTGQTTQPGLGVASVITSGELTAHLVMQDLCKSL
jgi:phytoene desaturase